MARKIEIIYYDVGEARFGPVRLTVLRRRSSEKVEADIPFRGDEEYIEWGTLGKIYEMLARLVEEARRKGRVILVEAVVDAGERRIIYGESTIPAKVQLAPRPARLLRVAVARRKGESEGHVEYMVDSYPVARELYVYEGRVAVDRRDVEMVIVETEVGPRVLRRGEFEII